MGKCERCGGFMIKDSMYSVDGQFLEIEMARCVNCGHIVDFTRLKILAGKHDRIQKEEVLV